MVGDRGLFYVMWIDKDCLSKDDGRPLRFYLERVSVLGSISSPTNAVIFLKDGWYYACDFDSGMTICREHTFADVCELVQHGYYQSLIKRVRLTEGYRNMCEHYRFLCGVRLERNSAPSGSTSL